jgi:uncharacterized protein YndB with AHSA1/START domain
MDTTMATAVERTVTVEAPAEKAFRVFTDGLSTWWPIESHKIGASECASVTIEPREGGRWFETGVDGVECDHGRVLVWEPPTRLVLVWQISSTWAFDPALHTEVEVNFIAESPTRTRVELVHRGLDAYGDDAQQMADTFGAEGGWNGLLRAYAAAAA